jgi:hypothetical protein
VYVAGRLAIRYATNDRLEVALEMRDLARSA